ncbi:murein hydrolase activator EnvC family protein [Actinomadura fibrosa]|uniref:Murein hydrolase activator EnvC family protein n=1 Tax=Actinomadura fibrosa TaxID=111802 RepID=A0ABW2XY06_9ACTN|nr:M23 family metallopeptidase [Actinomadura fibrosa]
MALLTLLLTCMIVPGAPGPHVWQWPLGPPVPKVLRAFSPPSVPWAPGHRGVDLAARPGWPVRAASAGRVSYAGRLAGRGVVAIDHGRLRTTYLPVRPGVRVGRQVATGTRIGVLEDSPFDCPTSCLHWGLLRDHLYLDPLSLVRPQVRLLPHWTPPAPKKEQPVQPSISREPSMSLRDATTATGGAVTGMVLAYALAFAWRRTRPRRRRRPPAGVIDLTRERRLRRTP